MLASDSGKDSLLIASSSMNEKRLSFKDGSTVQEVVRNYAQNNLSGPGHRRSLVPRSSVSMSPIKKEPMNDIKEAIGSSTEIK